ncbi:thioesterase family protein [Xylariomycetidae sp. FL2044]|nr:thioesterase family protein [Xylariomycetidae sp. FL2044]
MLNEFVKRMSTKPNSIFEKQISLRQVLSHTYTISHHADWTIGHTLHGGVVAAAIHVAARTHLTIALAAQNQPDVYTLHIEYLRPCNVQDSVINVTELKIGASACTLQLQLLQDDKLRAVALVTSTNFDIPAGPSAATEWRLRDPEPAPTPDFGKIEAYEPDDHWIPTRVVNEVLPFTGRLLILKARRGNPVGVLDAWNRFVGGERVNPAYLTFMTDVFPSMADTLLRNGGPYDANGPNAAMEEWAEKNPGVPFEQHGSLQDVMRATVFNNTVTLDVEFKRRIPDEGLGWVFTRVATRMFEGGRMDLDITICNQEMDILCLARQAVLILDVKKKFQSKVSKSAL